jgi:V8-like Glu-specific endopeptidase
VILTDDVFASGREFVERTLEDRRMATGRLLNGEVFEIDEDPILRRAIAEAAGVEMAVAAAIARGERDTQDLSPEQALQVKQVKAKVIDSSEPLAFADQALRAALAVGRIASGDAGLGTCFMISPRLVATAGHVILDAPDLLALRVEFTFDELPGRRAIRAQFSLDPGKLLLLPQDLGGIDVAVIALGSRSDDSTFTPEPCSLTDGGFAHQTGYHANIIHHPRNVPHLVVRDNWLLRGDPIHLSYRSQTDAGSSGAPVFNAMWKPIALHVEGRTGKEPLFKVTDRVLLADEVNWGIRTHVIYQRLRDVKGLDATKQALVDEAAPPQVAG